MIDTDQVRQNRDHVYGNITVQNTKYLKVTSQQIPPGCLLLRTAKSGTKYLKALFVYQIKSGKKLGRYDVLQQIMATKRKLKDYDDFDENEVYVK